MIYLLIKLIHLFSVFIYAGFLFTDNLILMRMQTVMSNEKYIEIRSHFAQLIRNLVPKALIVAVVSGIVLFIVHFGEIGQDGLSNFQVVLLMKATLGLWLGARGVLQVFFGIQPFIFKSHRLPFVLVILIIILSQVMYQV